MVGKFRQHVYSPVDRELTKVWLGDGMSSNGTSIILNLTLTLTSPCK